MRGWAKTPNYMRKASPQFIIAVVVVVLVLGIGYIGVRQVLDQGEVREAVSEPMENEIEAEEKIDEVEDIGGEEIDTSDWQMYRNEEYGFEFRYPPFLENITLREDGVLFSDVNVQYRLVVEIRKEELNPSTIESIYGPVKSKYIDSIEVAGTSSYRFKEGDAGCGGYDYRVPYNSSRHFRLYFFSCSDAGFLNEDQVISSFQLNRDRL